MTFHQYLELVPFLIDCIADASLAPFNKMLLGIAQQQEKKHCRGKLVKYH